MIRFLIKNRGLVVRRKDYYDKTVIDNLYSKDFVIKADDYSVLAYDEEDYNKHMQKFELFKTYSSPFEITLYTDDIFLDEYGKHYGIENVEYVNISEEEYDDLYFDWEIWKLKGYPNPEDYSKEHKLIRYEEYKKRKQLKDKENKGRVENNETIY